MKLSTASDGFNDRVRVYFSLTTDWDATVGVAHSAVFNALDLGDATPIFVQEEYTTLPQAVTIAQNYPNPFNPSTTIGFTLPEGGSASLIIYNIAGQKIRELVSESLAAGRHTAVWDGKDDGGAPVSAGIYFARLTCGGLTATGKMVMVK
ncbi:T9SS type A sorting domain-containing protein [bacterium]|nr:T9SS type A sorting domain-containing protein [bacterium]